jgi:hypothetical protein
MVVSKVHFDFNKTAGELTIELISKEAQKNDIGGFFYFTVFIK